MWKDIPNYEGYYRVSDKGEIFSVKSNKLRKLNIKKNGYVEVDLYKDGQVCWKRVHIAVAQAFIPNPESLPIVMHKDNNKANNCVENLMWGTLSENTKQAYDDGLFIHNKLMQYRVYSSTTNHEMIFIGAKAIKESLNIGSSTVSYYTKHPEKSIIRGKYRGYKIESLGRVADMERSTTIL